MIAPDLLARMPMLRDATPAARQALLDGGTLREFAPDDVIWRAGSEARGLLLVLQGEVRVVRNVRGRTHVLHVEGAGGTLGEVPLFAGGGHPATAVASRRTTCLVLGREALLAALRADPAFAFTLLRPLALRLRTVIGRLDRITGQTVEARLAGHLLVRVEEAGQASFGLGVTQRELAEELGTVREVVVRGLRRLREDGAIEPAGRGRWRVADREKLLAASRR